MAFFKIQLVRSAVGLPQRTRGVLEALGLRKRTATVYLPVTRDTAGMIFKVKELVKVEETETALSWAEMKAQRTPDPGFYIEKLVQPRVPQRKLLNKLVQTAEVAE